MPFYQFRESNPGGSFTHKPATVVIIEAPNTNAANAKAMDKGIYFDGVEQGGVPLSGFSHPKRAIYLLGSEDNGLPKSVLDRCNAIVALDSIRENSYNVAVSGSLVAYHRQFGGS